MNRGVLQQSPTVQQQQMMVATGSPTNIYSWWNNNNNYNTMQRPSNSAMLFLPQLSSPASNSTFFSSSSSSSSSSSTSSSSTWHGEYNFHQDLPPPESWTHLLMGSTGIMGGDHEEDHKCDQSELGKIKLQNWEEPADHLQHRHHVLNQAEDHEDHHHPYLPSDVIKQEKPAAANNSVYGHGGGGGGLVHQNDQMLIHQPANNNWSQMILMSANNNNNNNMLNFSTNKPNFPSHPDRSSQCNSRSSTTGTGGAVKKARVQGNSTTSTTQPTFKVRKEKLGDRITALHQLVSPFGKTDTASVLLEAIGYIRFLQSQVEALSLPYLGGGAGNISHQQPVQGERNCLFPDDPGQLLNDHCIKRKGAPDHQDSHDEEKKKDLRSRGLCLVPISCTMQVESSNGADYWTPAALGGGFR